MTQRFNSSAYGRRTRPLMHPGVQQQVPLHQPEMGIKLVLIADVLPCFGVKPRDATMAEASGVPDVAVGGICTPVIDCRGPLGTTTLRCTAFLNAIIDDAVEHGTAHLLGGDVVGHCIIKGYPIKIVHS